MEKFYAKKQHITLVGLLIHFLNHSGSHEQNELKEGKKGFKMTLGGFYSYPNEK